MENDYRYLLKVGSFIILITINRGYYWCIISNIGVLKRLSIPFKSRTLHHIAHYWKYYIMENDYRYLLKVGPFIILLTTGVLYHGERLSIPFKSRILHQKEEIVQLLEEIGKICKDFLENKDPEKFFSSYFSNITANAETFSPNYPFVSSTTVMMQLGEVIFVKLNKSEVTERLPTPSSEK